jgi:hypothetical protein
MDFHKSRYTLSKLDFAIEHNGPYFLKKPLFFPFLLSTDCKTQYIMRRISKYLQVEQSLERTDLSLTENQTRTQILAIPNNQHATLYQSKFSPQDKILK